MIELPEAITLAAEMQAAFGGKKLTHIEAGHSPHGFAFYCGDPKDYPALLEGKTLDRVVANGGQVEMQLGDARLYFNDGVNIRYLEPGAPEPKKHQLYVLFEGGAGFYCTISMYGGMQAFVDGTNDNFYYLVAKQKPSPLSDEFSESYFMDIVEQGGPKLSAKALLATEQRIPGLGNGCLQDILFNARVNPQSKVGALEKKQLKQMYNSVKSTLAAMTKAGGRDTEKNLYGESGGYKTILSAKTAIFPCPVCGGPVTKKAYMGGSVYFCERCQPILK